MLVGDTRDSGGVVHTGPSDGTNAAADTDDKVRHDDTVVDTAVDGMVFHDSMAAHIARDNIVVDIVAVGVAAGVGTAVGADAVVADDC